MSGKCFFLGTSNARYQAIAMSRDTSLVLYVALMAAIIIAVDYFLLRGHFWARLAVNIAVVIIFAAFYFEFLKRA